MIRQGFSNRVEYTLSNVSNGALVIREPRSWNEDQKEYVRNKKYNGILSKISAEMVFTGNGKDYIESVEDSQGVNAVIQLLKRERNSKTDVWEDVFKGFLDLSTMEIEGSELKVKMNIDGLAKLMKSRLSEKYELERLTDTFGGALQPLSLNRVLYNGRKIFLKSFSETSYTDRSSNFNLTFKSKGYPRSATFSIPTTPKYQSDTHFQNVSKNLLTTTPNIGIPGQMNYLINDREKVLLLDFNFKTLITVDNISEISNPFFHISIIVYENGSNYDLKSITNLYTDPSVFNIHNRQIDISDSREIILKAGESFAYLIYVGASDWGNYLYDGDYDISFWNMESSLEISEDSFYEKTQSNILLPHEAGQRLTEIITGSKDAFYSDILGRIDLNYSIDGEASRLALTHGHWIRNFEENLTDNGNKYKPFTTSFKDFIQSYAVLWNLSYGIERVGNSERIRVEPKDFFFNRNTLIRLGKEVDGKFKYIQVNKVKRSQDITMYASEIEIGSDRGGEYEEINGLDEYNGKSTFTTVINKVAKSAKYITKYRRDAIGAEIARRLQKKENPTLDSKYDSHIFAKDLKKVIGTDVLQERLWQDDFEDEPTGVFSPETATNLRLTQVNMLIRLGSVISSGLVKYPLDYLRFGSSTANANLETKLIGLPYRKENGNIRNNELNRSLFIPKLIEFEYIVDSDMIKLIEGNTTVLNTDIPNFYGLVAFKNEKGKIEKGWINSIKTNGKGKWKLILENNE